MGQTALERIEKTRRDSRNALDLSSRGLKALPREIGSLTNLSELDLGGNQLTTLPEPLMTAYGRGTKELLAYLCS